MDCTSEREAWQILDAKRDFVDSGLVQMMEKVAKDFAEEVNKGEADFLIDVAHQLNFLLQVLRATSRSSGNSEVVYPLLEKKLDVLNDKFAQVLRSWATATLTELEPEQARDTTAVIGDFSRIIKQFQIGDLASNLEIAIVGEEIVADIFEREMFPKNWAINQINLGNSYDAYDETIGGNEEKNRETAIRHYQAALQVLKRDKSPNLWAGAIGNLGIAYCKRLRGDPLENLAQGITAIQSALQVYTFEDFPREWALFQQHFGLAYMDLADEERIERKSAENLKTAIRAFQSALKVYRSKEFPEKWADNQINLGNAYDELGKIDEAIACYRRSLEVYTPTDYCSESLETARCFGDTAFDAGRWAEAIEGYGIAIEEQIPMAEPVDKTTPESC